MQLALLFWRFRVGECRRHRLVLSAYVPQKTAGSQLGDPKLREEIYKMMNWWLDKGIAGFRVDAIMNIKKPLPFQDYPADPGRRIVQCRRNPGKPGRDFGIS